MTAREALQAVKPLAEFARAVQAIETLTREAVRIEQGREAAEARLRGLHEAIAAAERKAAALEQAMAQRQAAVEAAARDRERAAAGAAAQLVAEAEARVAGLQQAEATARAKAEQAERDHAATVARLQTDRAALQQQVDELRDLARRMAQRAAAVA